MKQNKYNKSILITIVIMTIISITSINSVIADPAITIDPSQPEALSSVKFTAVVNDEGVTNVDLIIRECTVDKCFLRDVITMTKISDDSYEGSYTLEKSDAIYFNYILEVDTDNGTITYDDYTNVTYKASSNGGSNGGGDSDDTPGFEAIGLLISVIFISFILYRRKR